MITNYQASFRVFHFRQSVVTRLEPTPNTVSFNTLIIK